MDWEEAIEEAKEELGYSSNEYVEDWQRIVDEAKDILTIEREKEYEEYCDEAWHKYQEHLKSDWWKELRLKRLIRDNFICKDCKEKATEVHHTSYNHLKTPWEIYEIISLCRRCHKKRHKIK